MTTRPITRERSGNFLEADAAGAASADGTSLPSFVLKRDLQWQRSEGNKERNSRCYCTHRTERRERNEISREPDVTRHGLEELMGALNCGFLDLRTNHEDLRQSVSTNEYDIK
jgi:hypothetical protein